MPDEKVTPEFLERLKAHLRANAALVNMNTFTGYESYCGTAACVAHHAAIVSGREVSEGIVLTTNYDVSQWAARFFGFESSDPADAPLFYIGAWPAHLREMYQGGNAQYIAEACCMAIDHFFPPQQVAS